MITLTLGTGYYYNRLLRLVVGSPFPEVVMKMDTIFTATGRWCHNDRTMHTHTHECEGCPNLPEDRTNKA